MRTRFGAHTITILRPPPADQFGDPTGPPAEREVSGAFMQPVTTTERLDGRDTVVSGWQVFLPPSTDIRATDQVRWRDDLYEVDGDPQPQDDLAGRTRHLEVRLRRVTG
ncbi:hypothetical protein [Streptomyces corynorhini]|uniref:Head-tail adaptor protein n=1 Tax=Streptomyces corynorhini TaxID=2282652 RepID=A0A370B833_9ACTN|nr:hypothetical protein [Streptomyces corynorhini]RDG37960.1 hypothetical protein DVH02_11595 [Streptomyces corynorhini]